MSMIAEHNEVPFSVRQYLDNHNVSYKLVAAAQFHYVESVLLEDELGTVQCFVGSNTVLDLAKLNNQTGRKLRSPSYESLQKTRLKLGLQTLPALDLLTHFETYIDQAVLEKSSIIIQSGNPKYQIQLPSAETLYLGKNYQIYDFSSAIPDDDIEYDLALFDLDREAIHSSLSKFTSLRIKQRLEETLEIPPLPESAQAIIRLRVDPNADINKLSKIVENDPSLAAQVMSWATSSYYAAPGSVKSIQDAIVRVLGYDLVMNLALGLALGKTLDLPKDSAEGYAPYWKQSVYVAATVGSLLNCIPREFRPSFGYAYLVGLLHNFGYLVLGHVFKPHFSTLCRSLEANPHLGSQHVEYHVLGITREQIASNLLKSWNLPDEVCLGIRYQNEVNYLGPSADFAQLAYLARALLIEHKILRGPSMPIPLSIYTELNMNKEDVEEIMQQIRDAQAELDSIANSMS